MYKNNSRDSRFLGLCSPLQYCNILINNYPAIGYYSYTIRTINLLRKKDKKSRQIEPPAINSTCPACPFPTVLNFGWLHKSNRADGSSDEGA